jgi:hypothetical protein
MFLDMACMVNAQTLDDGLLLRVSKQVVVNDIRRDPQLAMNMLAGISRRVHGLIRDVEGYTLHSRMQRLIGYLLRHIETDSQGETTAPVTVALSASKATITSRLSLTPEYFSRVLHELEEAGLIQIRKREIHILDIQRLAASGSQSGSGRLQLGQHRLQRSLLGRVQPWPGRHYPPQQGHGQQYRRKMRRLVHHGRPTSTSPCPNGLHNPGAPSRSLRAPCR